jgi:pSer/pThr/pTyr-binding forkhead associated (FHA) protein
MPGGQATMIMPTGPRPEPSFAWLVTVSGVSNNPYIGQPFPIKSAGTTTIGRVPGNDILVPDPACSSQHAKVRSEPDEEGKQAFVIYDLASTNGLYVGSKADYKEESSRKYRHALHDGDYVLIGETTLVFKQV